MITGLKVANALIHNISNCWEENEEEKELIDFELTEQKDGPEMMKMLLTLDYQVYKKKSRKILLTSLKTIKAKWWGYF